MSCSAKLIRAVFNKDIVTKKNGDAYDIAKSLPLDDFDILLSVSGDGLIHEILNGLAHHAHPRKALRMPVAPIPTGSGNGLALNLLGLEVCNLILQGRSLVTAI